MEQFATDPVEEAQKRIFAIKNDRERNEAIIKNIGIFKNAESSHEEAERYLESCARIDAKEEAMKSIMAIPNKNDRVRAIAENADLFRGAK